MSSLKKFKPLYWRSLAELENTPEFREFVEREFATPLEQVPPNSPQRRRFLQIMGASLGLAGAGCRWHEDKLVPLTRRPDGMTPGVPKKYATSMEIDGQAVGLHVTSYDGRPIKVDGNPRHPDALGACSVLQQASVLGLYDPDRSDTVKRGGKASSWDEFSKFAKEHFGALRGKGGAGLHVLSERSSSPTLADLRTRFLQAFPQAKWTTYEPGHTSALRKGSELAFGKAYRTLYDFSRARVIVSLDADFVSHLFPRGLANARTFSRTRTPDREMSRFYAIESTYTHAGAHADHRLPLPPRQIKALAAYLDAAITPQAKALPELGAAQPSPDAAFLKDPKTKKFLDAMVKDLVGSVGRSLIVAGPEQPAEVHAIAHRLNALLGNVARTVLYVEDPMPDDAGEDLAAIKALVAGADSVDTLLILGGNPAYATPGDVPFGAALAKIKNSIHLSLYEDETSSSSSWHLPAAHYLESWGDSRGMDGVVSIQQPLIAPLHGGRSALELLDLLLGNDKPDGFELVKRTHQQTLPDERALRRAIHESMVIGTTGQRVMPKLQELPKVALSEAELGAKSNGYELIVALDPKVHDGRFTNNGWLQELPGMFSKLAWDNCVLVPMDVAKEQNLEDGVLVDLSVGGKTIRLPAVVAPGQAPGVLKVTLGYGRTHAGHVGGLKSAEIEPVGANAYLLVSSEDGYLRSGATIQKIGGGPRLAMVQDLYAIDPIGHEGTAERLHQIVREGTLEEYREKPEFAKERVHSPPLLSMWKPPTPYEGHKWGMAVDLGKCIGCNACVTACQAENNIPVTGREPVSMGREMFWLRIDRYYKGEPEDAEVSFQPMPCQQCENAPCEQVCPVGATMHSKEGLNDMVYNRCIGTRYCSNNCPYKVRHFNYFNYNLDVIGITPYTPTEDPKMKIKSMVFNPEVTVRSRGVMEKCTFCVQRIQNVKIKAKNEGRPIADQEIRTACQDTCPTEAIVFGDLNDPKSLVARLHKQPRAYELLGELNNRPRVQYLARIKNPNPELA